MSSSEDPTQMLLDVTAGHRAALDELMPLVYDELRRLAHRYLRNERPDHTLQTTALVHEAYLRLVDQTRINWHNRVHFIAIAGHLMRQILVNHAIARKRAKRGGGDYRLSVEKVADWPDESAVDLIALDEALNGLTAIDPQQSHIVELRFFGGLTVEETAEVLGLSTATIKREWRTAKAWLHSQIKR